jgi:putative flavoprotein involved in K+ transport
VPGLYFVGLKFLYSVSSEQIHGVGRDAARIADAIAARREDRRLEQNYGRLAEVKRA